MSRSKPTENTPNPSTRWFEWNGAEGHFRYYDKDKEKNVDVKGDFIFILLDELATIKGFHEPSNSSIYSNEVRDTRDEPFVVKSFKGGKIAEGIYADIRDKAAAQGGHFVSNCYIAYKEGKQLKIGSVQFKGAALSAWFDFRKDNRKAIYEGAITVTCGKKEKKGKVEFFRPEFELKEISEESNKQAVTLDIALQEYLDGYFKRTRVEQAERPQPDAHGGASQPDAPPDSPPPDGDEPPPPPDDDVPF